MRYVLPLLMAVALLSSFGCTRKKEKVVIRLNDIEITVQEFQHAYRASPFYHTGSDGLRAFLDQYISKKMLLNEAERQGLDKGPQFLTDIQQYWEQELLKLTLAKANSDRHPVPVLDRDIEEYFASRQQDLFAGKALADVREQIREYLVKEHRKEALQQWLENIKNGTRVEIDYTALEEAQQ